MSQKIKHRKNLNADALFSLVRSDFKKIKDLRSNNIKISLSDALMSGFAMFSLKGPSLLVFEARQPEDTNLKPIYKINNVPCDTQMRTILDEVDPADIEPSFKNIFRKLQRGKVLEPMIFMNRCYLISIDGTGYFSSNKIHCDSCCMKTNSKTGKITYQHQMLGAAIVHPDIKEVIPLAPEPIIKQDGESKNDSERNASKRFLEKMRKTHPHLHLIVIEDGLSSNAPHIRELKKHHMHYILGAKKGDHAFLFDYVESATKEGLTTEIEHQNDDIVHQFRFINQVPLNASNQDLLVNFIEYWETTPKKTMHFSWVTDLHVTEGNVSKIMRGGRARWRIENETFNTLKNQGYHFEHNFGHGKKNLSVVFAMLMMLAFLVDQTQQIACQLFQAAWGKLGSKRNLWGQMRALFYGYKFDSMEDILRALFYGFKRERLIILEDPTQS
ncbi:MAG: Transposase DDE domain-containing protein [Candidatus Methanomarinus sp.]|nr:MAG: Transposase DDE domain-containing protein [ANME-2 cluster archaeon]